MRLAAALAALLLTFGWALPFSLQDEDRLFGSRELLLENPGRLTGLEGARVYFAVEGALSSNAWGRGYAFAAGSGWSLGGGLGWPLWGFLYAAGSEAGVGLAGYVYPGSQSYGLALGYAGAEEAWGWIEGGPGALGLRLYYRGRWDRLRTLVAAEWTPGVRGRLAGYVGDVLARGDERLFRWGGLSLSRGRDWTEFGLEAGARWRSPVLASPVVVDLRATTALTLTLRDQAEATLLLDPLVFRADWLWVWGPLELKARLPVVRVFDSGEGLEVELLLGASGWLALR